MVNRIRTVYLHWLHKGFSSKFCEGSQVQQETLDQREHQLKHCVYNNKDEDNSLNTLDNMNFGTLFFHSVTIKIGTIVQIHQII